jgi:DNA replication ATP-dependent helicase Dna2
MSSLKKQGLEFSTIDKYQGRDKSVIILSFVRSNEKGNAGRLLQDARRLNVALTRAKCKMIAVGSFKTLSCGSVPLKPILNRMDKRNQRIIFPETALRCYETQ